MILVVITTDVHKGTDVMTILLIVLTVSIIAIIATFFYLQQTGGLESIANRIGCTLSSSCPP